MPSDNVLLIGDALAKAISRNDNTFHTTSREYTLSMDDHYRSLTLSVSTFEPSPCSHVTWSPARDSTTQSPSLSRNEKRKFIRFRLSALSPKPDERNCFSTTQPPQQKNDSALRRTSIYDTTGLLQTEVVKWDDMDDMTYHVPVNSSTEALKYEALRDQGGQQRN